MQNNIDKYTSLVTEAKKAYNERKWDKAIEIYEEAIEINCQEDDLLNLAICYLETNNSFKAQKIIDLVISILPEDGIGYFYKGVYYDYIDDIESALNEYLTAVNKNFCNSEVFFRIGYIYDMISEGKDKTNTELAVTYYLKAIDYDENHLFANLNLGSIYEVQNDLSKAIKYALKAYEIDKNESRVCYNLGVIYSKLGKDDIALKYYLEEINNENPYKYVYFNIGIIFKDNNDYLNAEKYYLEGLKYLKDDSYLWYNLGCLYVLKNEYKLAFDCFKCSISLDKDILDYMYSDEEIKEFLDSMEFKELIKN